MDRFTLKIVNNRMFQEGDFYENAPSGGIYLTDAARNRYFAAYEQFIAQPVACAGEQGGADFRRQAERLRKAVIEEGPYKPFTLDG